jgi:hypothetical protein
MTSDRLNPDKIRVIVHPDPRGRLFADDPDPGSIVFGDSEAPLLHYGEHPEHGPGWTLDYLDSDGPTAGVDDHFIPGEVSDVDAVLSDARSWLRRIAAD